MTNERDETTKTALKAEGIEITTDSDGDREVRNLTITQAGITIHVSHELLSEIVKDPFHIQMLCDELKNQDPNYPKIVRCGNE